MIDGRADEEPTGVRGGCQANEGPHAVVVQRGDQDGDHGACPKYQSPVPFVEPWGQDVDV